MTTKTDGGPAFPESGERGKAAGGEGMDLRDYFAAKAMQALITSNDVGAGDRIDEIPEYAYLIADAMLKERENT